MSMRITMIGTGYVGLVTGTCFADLGHDVICVDKDRGKIDGLHAGCMPIYEPGLEAMVARNVEAGRLRFSNDLAASVKRRDAVFIAVGTPTEPGSDRANLSYVVAAAEEIAVNIDQFTVVVTKSTVPVGTNRMVQEIVARSVPAGLTAAVASNPEFLREGSAIGDFMEPDRVVCGADNEQAMDVLRRIYAPLDQQGCRVLFTEIETAEVIKYAANAFLAVKISYINEIADLCEVVGADVERVATAIGMDHRIGAAFLRAGPGWGGSCFPKDTRALKAMAAEHVVPLRILEAAIEANARRRDVVLQKIEAACGGSVKGKRIAVFGLTFKGQTDDVRESPSIEVIRELAALGARVRAYDPAHPAEAGRMLPQLVMASRPVEAVRSADALVVLTDWKEFLECDLGELAAYMAQPILVDIRNLFNENEARMAGFGHYVRIGRRSTGRAGADQAHAAVPLAGWTSPRVVRRPDSAFTAGRADEAGKVWRDEEAVDPQQTISNTAS